MVKLAFEKLPTEKQDTIIQAAIQEFSDYPYAEASINRIIKAANISRGSFYLYFNDKQDLFHYLLEQLFIQPLANKMAEQTTYSKANIFDYTAFLFQQLAPLLTAYLAFARQWLAHIEAQEFTWFFQQLAERNLYKISRSQAEHLRFRSAKEQKKMLQVLQGMLYAQLYDYSQEEQPNVEANKTQLLKYLLMLKIGFQR